jgi:hypothetical protein
MARKRDSPVEKGYNPGDDQEYSGDFHDCSCRFNLGMAMLSIFSRHPTFMQKTLRVVCGWFLPFKAKHDCRQPAV